MRVIVTAGASGIGRSIAQRFIDGGARVTVCDIDEVALDALKCELPGVMTAAVDVSDEDQVISFVHDVDVAFGGIDALINNAGIAGACQPLEALDFDSWRRSFAVNVDGCFLFTKAVAPVMKRQGGGSIVNISTGSVVTHPTGRADYIASKWAVEGLTRATARELGPAGIRVNAVRPGFVDSARMETFISNKAQEQSKRFDDVEADYLRYISMRAKVQPEEVAALAFFLTSKDAPHISGQIISVDGNVEWES